MAALRKQQSWLFCLCCLYFFLAFFLSFHMSTLTSCKSIFIELSVFLCLHLPMMN